MDHIEQLVSAGVSIWLDTLSRDLVDSGELARLVRDRGVTGATSNPSIFAKAITSSDAYDADVRRLSHHDAADVFLALATDDVRRAADVLRDVYDRTGGGDGFVSIQCTPDLAYDAVAMVAQARDLWVRLDRPNAMIKVPATGAGVAAVEELVAAGVNVNVTLLFSVERYRQVMDAWLRGLERRVAAGADVRDVASVASFFVSRVDTRVDALLPAGSPLRGEVAVANAVVAYEAFLDVTASGRWRALERRGARPQRPLWASTATKDDAYPDLLYVATLVADGVVNTMPLDTLEKWADHGSVASRLADAAGAHDVLRRLSEGGVDLAGVTGTLEDDGVRAFLADYEQVLGLVREKAAG